MPEPTPPHRSHTLPLYVGGFLGPFGGAVLAVLIPELRDAFDATTTEIALAVPAYLVPFALLQLVSGTLAERIGRRRVVTIAYTVYAVGSIGAPSRGDRGVPGLPRHPARTWRRRRWRRRPWRIVVGVRGRARHVLVARIVVWWWHSAPRVWWRGCGGVPDNHSWWAQNGSG